MDGGQPGWQEDPTRRAHLRYWDGAAWTDQVADASGNVSTDPFDQAAAVAPPPPPAKGSRRGLAIALAVVVLLLGGGAAVLLTSGDDDPDVSTEPTDDEGDDETTTTEEPTTTTEATTTTTILDDPTEVVGTSIGEAVGALEDAGFEVTEVEVIDETVTDGQVTAAVEQPDGSVVLTVARPPVTRFLEQLRPVDELGSTFGPTFNVSGTTYTHGVGLSGCNNTLRVEYDLGRDFRRFQAVAGLLDAVSSTLRVRMEISLDGDIVDTKDLGLGDTAAIDLDVSDRLRLTISVTEIADDRDSCGTDFGFGDGRLLGVPSEVPALPE